MVLVCLVDRADHWMNNASGASQQTNLKAGGRGVGSGAATHDLACTLGSAFDKTTDQLFDRLLRRDFLEWSSGPFDASNVLYHERCRHAEISCARTFREANLYLYGLICTPPRRIYSPNGTCHNGRFRFSP